MQFIKKNILYFFILTCLMGILPITLEAATTIRAALDIGSGATKLRVAEVDLKTSQIVNILESKSFTTPYQEKLSKSSEGVFDHDVMEIGLNSLKESVEIAKKYGAEKVIAVATAAFRKAKNSETFIQKIYEETGIEVNVIDQGLEGELAFKAVQSQLGVPPADLVVWDIGGGSLQLTTVDPKGELIIYRGNEASTPFKNFVIEEIQDKKISHINSPNPLNVKEIMQANAHAQRLAQKVDRVIKDKINAPQTIIVGVGNIFGYQLTSMFDNQKSFTRDGLVGAVADLAGKSDRDVGGGDFANVYVTNAALILGFMEGLDINQMQITDINPADGAFFYAPFWEKQLKASRNRCVCKSES